MFILILLFLSKVTVAQNKIFYVNSYSTNLKDGQSDDVKIQRCIDDALLNESSTVILSDGDFNLLNTINIDVSNGQNILFKGGENTVLKHINADVGVCINVMGAPNLSRGSVNIESLKLIGPNIGIGKKNIFFNTVRHLYGIGVSSVNKIQINNCQIINFYGNGIDISNKRDRFNLQPINKLLIKNTSVINSWGKSPSISYGDGIYISDCKMFEVDNCIIINETTNYNPYGRSGIVIEDEVFDGTIKNCIVSGYNNGIHVENNLGKTIITNNILKNNLINIYCWNDYNSSLLIDKNKFYQNIKTSEYKAQKLLNIDIKRNPNLSSNDTIINNLFYNLRKSEFKDLKSKVSIKGNVIFKDNIINEKDH